jgi:hypothetical protein
MTIPYYCVLIPYCAPRDSEAGLAAPEPSPGKNSVTGRVDPCVCCDRAIATKPVRAKGSVKNLFICQRQND